MSHNSKLGAVSGNPSLYWRQIIPLPLILSFHLGTADRFYCEFLVS